MGKLLTYSMVSIVVALVVAFVLFNFYGKIEEAYAEESAKQICKASVYGASKLKLQYWDLSYADFSDQVKCPTAKLSINDRNKDTAKKKLADAMYDCWGQFGEGKLDLFNDDNVYCSICHRVTFGKDVKIGGFMKYLANNKIPDGKTPYLQYLTAERTDNSEFLKAFESNKIEDNIDGSKNSEYAIIFTYIKGKRYLDDYLQKAKYTSPGIGLIALGFGIIKAGSTISAIVSGTGVGAPAGLLIQAGSLSVGGSIMAVGALWTGVSPFISGVPFDHIALISFVPYNAESIKSLNCRDIPTKQ